MRTFSTILLSDSKAGGLDSCNDEEKREEDKEEREPIVHIFCCVIFRSLWLVGWAFVMCFMSGSE